MTAVGHRRPRLSFVSKAPLPYHTPILNALTRNVVVSAVYLSGRPWSELEKRAGSSHVIDFTAFGDQWGQEPRYEYAFVRSHRLYAPGSDIRLQIPIGITSKLIQQHPDVVLISSWGPLVIEPAVWRFARGSRIVMWAESTKWSGLFRGRIANAMRSMLLRHVDAFVTNGTQASAYLESLGVERSLITTSCLPTTSTLTRATDGQHRPRAFLYVGRLIPLKQPLMVIDAFRIVLARHPESTLTIIGDGPLEAQVRAQASVLGSACRVMGRLEGAALAKAYDEADIFVYPSSRDVWGLVVNEALAHGLYVIASKGVGSAHDLIDEHSGTVVDAGDAKSLARAMLDAPVGSSDVARRPRAQRVADCTPERFAADIVRAMTIALLPDRRQL